MDASVSDSPALQATPRSLQTRLEAGDDHLRAAHDVLRRAVGHDRDEYGPAIDAGELGRQVSILRKWAETGNLLISEDQLPKIVKGGREHSLVRMPSYLERVVKVTIGPEFGFYAACLPKSQYRDVCHWFTTVEALPSQYFERLRLLNELFPRCYTRLAGFVWSSSRLHALTAQLIAQGRPAALQEIAAWLQSLGYQFISAWTWFHPESGVALFDVLEKNVMRCDDGELVPFDVIPIRCEGTFLEMMNNAARRMAGTSVGSLI